MAAPEGCGWSAEADGLWAGKENRIKIRTRKRLKWEERATFTMFED